MGNVVDANSSALFIAEEESYKVLPATPIWYEQEVDSYNDFGGEIKTVARNPINSSRQKAKGTVVDFDASGGFEQDFTQTNTTRSLQGFFFADAREKATTKSLHATAIPITSITTSGFAAASGLDSFKAGDLIVGTGMDVSVNDGVAKVTAAIAALVTVDKTLTAEASPGATSAIEVCGFEAAAGDLTITASASEISLGSTVLDFTTLGLIPGEWLFVGGDAAINKFANNEAGYARVSAIATNKLSFDETTWTPVTEAGGVLEIQLFFGVVIRNEKDPALIKRRSYNLERQLGNDGNGIQSESLIGSIANEFELKVPQADKLAATLNYVSSDNVPRTGTEGIKSGTRVSAPAESAINTSQDLYRIKLSVIDPDSLNPTGLFGFVSDSNIKVSNGAEGSKALGVSGSFDITVGTFEASGSLNAFFTDVAGIAAIRNNADVGLSQIFSAKNEGFIFDLPLIGLGGGKLSLEKNKSVKIQLDSDAVESKFGHTALANFFQYLPNIAMAQQT